MKTYKGIDSLQAIEEGKVLVSKDRELMYKKGEKEILYFSESNGFWAYSSIGLNTFLQTEFTEYIEPLAVGDWVTYMYCNANVTFKIDNVGNDFYERKVRNSVGIAYAMRDCRKATEKEISLAKRKEVFLNAGRVLNEFRIGDGVEFLGYLYEVCGIDELESVKLKGTTGHEFWRRTEKVNLVFPIERKLDVEC